MERDNTVRNDKHLTRGGTMKPRAVDGPAIAIGERLKASPDDLDVCGCELTTFLFLIFSSRRPTFHYKTSCAVSTVRGTSLVSQKAGGRRHPARCLSVVWVSCTFYAFYGSCFESLFFAFKWVNKPYSEYSLQSCWRESSFFFVFWQKVARWWRRVLVSVR